MHRVWKTHSMTSASISPSTPERPVRGVIATKHASSELPSSVFPVPVYGSHTNWNACHGDMDGFQIPARAPWGAISGYEILSPGIVKVETASGDGIHLDQKRQNLMPPCLRQRGAWYRVAETAQYVVVTFPRAFSSKSYELARVVMSRQPGLLERAMGENPALADQAASYRQHLDEFLRSHADTPLVLSRAAMSNELNTNSDLRKAMTDPSWNPADKARATLVVVRTGRHLRHPQHTQLAWVVDSRFRSIRARQAEPVRDAVFTPPHAPRADYRDLGMKPVLVNPAEFGTTTWEKADWDNQVAGWSFPDLHSLSRG